MSDKHRLMRIEDLQTEPCPELNHHPQLKGLRPHPVGIANACVYRYCGTGIYQWWKQTPNAYWVPHGDIVILVGSFTEAVDRFIDSLEITDD